MYFIRFFYELLEFSCDSEAFAMFANHPSLSRMNLEWLLFKKKCE